MKKSSDQPSSLFPRIIRSTLQIKVAFCHSRKASYTVELLIVHFPFLWALPRQIYQWFLIPIFVLLFFCFWYGRGKVDLVEILQALFQDKSWLAFFSFLFWGRCQQGRSHSDRVSFNPERRKITLKMQLYIIFYCPDSLHLLERM